MSASKHPRPLDYPEPPIPGLPPGPNVRQALAHVTECDELLFGGARGGGKTEWAIAEALSVCFEFPGCQAVIFRQSFPQLVQAGGVVPRLLVRIPQSVGKYNSTDHVWSFNNGSKLYLAHVSTGKDVQKYLGGEYQLMVFEQAEQIDELTYRLLQGSLRVSGDVAHRMREAGYRPKILLTANPGGVGNEWLKQRFIDPFPLGEKLFRPAPTEDEPRPGTRCFIPSLLSDNPALEYGDPSYRRRLESLPEDERRAQLLGDWTVHKGTRFKQWSTAVHVVDPEDFPLPADFPAPRARGIDYGLDQPFVCLWGAKLADDLLYVYREVWKAGLTPTQQAEMILDSEDPRESEHGALFGFLDPACWAQSVEAPLPRTGGRPRRTGPPPGSIADKYLQAGVRVRQADNRRIDGAAALADRLRVRPDGRPRLLVSSVCTGLIATLPALQRDPRNPEDVIKNSKDHWYDALRYLERGMSITGVGTGTDAQGYDPQAALAGLDAARRARNEQRGLAGLKAVSGASTRGLRRQGF